MITNRLGSRYTGPGLLDKATDANTKWHNLERASKSNFTDGAIFYGTKTIPTLYNAAS